MGACAAGQALGLAYPQPLGGVPCLPVDDGFMGVGKKHQLVRRGGPALLGLEVLTDRLAEDGMPQIFPAVEYGADRVARPEIRVGVPVFQLPLRVLLRHIRSRYQHLVLGQGLGNLRGAEPVTGKPEYPPHDCRRFFIDNKGLLVAVQPGVAIGDGAAAPLSGLHPGTKDSLDFLACILRVIFVHDVQKRGKIVV